MTEPTQLPATGGTLAPEGGVTAVKIDGRHPALEVSPEMLHAVTSPNRFMVTAKLDDANGIQARVIAFADWKSPGVPAEEEGGRSGETSHAIDVPQDKLGAVEAALAALVADYRDQAMGEAMAAGYEQHRVNYGGVPVPTPAPETPAEGN